MIRYRYNHQLSPPAPFVHVSLQGLEGTAAIADLPAQLDTSVDITVVPTVLVERLGLIRFGTGQVSAFGVAFSPAGRRLISASGGREAVKLWDVGTRQELLTLSGTGSPLDAARWTADGDMILRGSPWQAWRAPSWEEIDAAEKAQAK